jgi:hypothetical protein
MSEKLILLIFSAIVIFLFSMNFNNKWTNRNYEMVKGKNGTWFWFRTFKIEETKENFVKVTRGLSILVIIIVTTGVIAILFLG